MSIRLVLFTSLVPLFALYADQIALTNGDRITGKVVTSDATTLTIKTEAMGEIKIQRSAIATLSTQESVHVTLKGSQVVGPVRTEDGILLVTKGDAVIMKAALKDVEAVRQEAAQKSWDREQLRLTHPPITDFWSGNISVNLATASGNARTTTFGTGAQAQRITGADKIVLGYTQIYSRQSTVVPFGPTANRVSGTARYDRNLGSRVLAFGLTAFDFDQFQDLDLRRVLGGGLGYHAIKTKNHWLDAGAGLTWNHEKFGTGLRRSSAELLISEESSHQITAAVKLFQRGLVFPNLSDSGEYRLNWDGGTSIALTRLLSWNVSVSDRYLSNPLPGRKSNDMIVTTGIGFNFSQK